MVEGRDDTANLKRYFDCETYETGGSSIDDRDLERLKRLEDKRGIMFLLIQISKEKEFVKS